MTSNTARNGAGMATVHIDLDGGRHIYRLRGWSWPGGPDTVYGSGIASALDTFDAYGIRATFFVIAEDLADTEKAEWLAEVVRRGHDIASHSLTHEPLAGLGREHKRSEIERSRDRIREALEVECDGFRAPYFSIDRECFDMLAAGGYTWDSSVLPGRAVPGLDGPVRERPWRAPADSELWELPLPAFRPLPFPFHPSYGLVLGFRYFRNGLERHVRRGAPLVLLFHLIDFADPLPAGIARGFRQRLFTLSNIDGSRKREACRRMIEAVRMNYDIVDTSTLLAAARSGVEGT